MNRLRKLRLERKLTLEAVAKSLGLRNQYVSNYELGRRNPDYETLKKFADFYGVTTDYLLEHDVPQKEENDALGEDVRAIARDMQSMTPQDRALLKNLVKSMAEKGANI